MAVPPSPLPSSAKNSRHWPCPRGTNATETSCSASASTAIVGSPANTKALTVSVAVALPVVSLHAVVFGPSHGPVALCTLQRSGASMGGAKLRFAMPKASAGGSARPVTVAK